jgi:ketosteroid isomerase-like protein
MSVENVEIVRRFYDAWARNDLPGPIELMDPEIEYVNPPRAVEPGTRRGLTAFSGAVEKAFEGLETWQIELEQLRPVGDQVAVVVRYRARWRERRPSGGPGVGLVDCARRQGHAIRLVS